MELEQAIDKRGRALDQRGSELEELSKQVEELEEEMASRSPQFGGLNSSTSALVRIHGPLLIFGLSSFVYWATRRLRSSLALVLPPPLTQVLPPTQIPPLLPPPPPRSPLKDPDAIYTSQQVGELPHAYGHWRACRCVEGALEEVDWGWDVELVGKEDQEVVLTLSSLLEWSILGLGGR